MNEGLIPLAHPENHQFRTRDKTLEKDSTGGIRVKK